MRFSRIIGTVDSPQAKALVQEAEATLSSLFAELSLGWDVRMRDAPLGGDPLQMQLLVPFPHHCDLTAFHFQPLKTAYKQEVVPALKTNSPLSKAQQEILREFEGFRKRHPTFLTTAATDGLRFYWEPQFLLSKSRLGQRLLLGHESGHASLLHPSRKNQRLASLWNIAADYRVNFLSMEDLRLRGFSDPATTFATHLGPFIPLEEYAAFLRDPYHPPPRLEPFGQVASFKRSLQPGYAAIDQEVLEEELPRLYYADARLPPALRTPEAIYEYLLKQVPRCQCCGKLGVYKKPKDYRLLEKKGGHV